VLVIPAIDLRGGRCVRLYRGEFGRETVFSEDPVEMARHWEQAGARFLHVVDLDAARSGKIAHAEVIRSICQAISIPVQLGGGLRDEAAVNEALALGIARGIIGTTAALDIEKASRIFAAFGERVAAGIDAREGKVAVQGWTEQTERPATELALELERAGARRIVFTDILRDGTETGPNLEAARVLIGSVKVPVVISGGVSRPEDLPALAALGAEACIVGRALYTGLMPSSVLKRDW
jgi:phosphoribosylformimino-5-aminoimidazole carboxamide ribotide isomerase